MYCHSCILLHRKIIVVIVFYLCNLNIADAQDSIPEMTKHSISITTGYSRQILRDEVASPLLYRGVNSPFFFEYDYNTSKGRHSIAFIIGSTKLRSSVANKIASYTNYADNFNALISYSYGKDANVFQHINVKSYWGFTFLSVFNYRNLHFDNSSTIPFFEQLNSLGANFLIEKYIGLKKLDFARFKINLPFVAYVALNNRYNAVVGSSLNSYDSKKGIIGQVISTGEFVTFNKLIEFQTELSFNKFLTEHLGIKVEHQLHFYSIAHYRKLLYTSSLDNKYMMGLFIKF
jgi:hypothetical protein